MDGSSNVQTDLKSPDGLHWLFELLVVSYSGANIAGIKCTTWYQPLVNPTTDVSKNVTLTKAAGDNDNVFPIIGGGYVYDAATQPILVSARKSLLLMDQHRFSISLNGTTVNGRNFQIRGLAWESPDIEELLCIAQSIH